MKQCLMITFSGKFEDDFLRSFVQKNANELGLEGTVQVRNSNNVRITVCGNKDNIDKFIDLIYEASATGRINGIEIAPFLKERDYRGVFRVIE